MATENPLTSVLNSIHSWCTSHSNLSRLQLETYFTNPFSKCGLGRKKGLDKTMETLQILYTILYEYGVGPPIAFNTATILLGMDSYKFSL
jgi:hypothetical protein